MSDFAAGGEDASWLALPLRDTSNSEYTGFLAKGLSACGGAAGEDDGAVGKHGLAPGDSSYQLLRALTQLLSSSDEKAAVKTSPLVCALVRCTHPRPSLNAISPFRPCVCGRPPAPAPPPSCKM